MATTKVITEFPRSVREIENTWIPMPDGTRLAARIWLPEDAEEDPVPAILEYLPYRKRDGTVARDHLTHPYFAGHGYAGLRVDMRGTGDSEGVCLGEYLLQEQDDALSVIEWLTQQPWCSGSVGMIGISWGGFNGLQVAARQPPALKAVISICSTDDRYADDIHFTGGAILCDKLNWGGTAFPIAHTPPDPAIVGDRWRDMWKERLDKNGLWLLDWFRNQRRTEFFAHGSVCEDYSQIKAPIYMVGGWADGYTNSVFRTLEHLPNTKKGLIGPWAHKYPHFAKPGPQIGFLQEALRWWDQHLKGIDTGILDEPQLRAWINDPAEPEPFFEERAGRWVAEPNWAGAARQSLGLHCSSTGLNAQPSTDHIHLKAPQTAGGASGLWCVYGMVPDGPLDQNQELGKLAAFESAPFEQDIDLLGFPELQATVSSSAPQANLVVTLSVISKTGRATRISFGVLNLTHRDGHADPQPMPVGTPVAISLRLDACGQRIAKGEKVRVSLGTSYWPMIWPAQTAAALTLADTKISLPLRAKSDLDADLAEFGPAEGATPLETHIHTEPKYSRTRHIDCVSGVETYECQTDTGAETHLHTGLTVQDTYSETYSIHPDDPNSAQGISKWHKSYARGDWRADIRTEISVRALRHTWHVEARLLAEDAQGVVADKSWDEKIPRDLV